MHRAAAKFMWFFPFPPLPFLPPHYQKQRHLEACLEFREVVNDVPFPPYSPDLVPRDCFVLYNESEVRRERERGGGEGCRHGIANGIFDLQRRKNTSQCF